MRFEYHIHLLFSIETLNDYVGFYFLQRVKKRIASGIVGASRTFLYKKRESMNEHVNKR